VGKAIDVKDRDVTPDCSLPKASAIHGLMTDDEWAYFEPFLTRRNGWPPCNNRHALEGAAEESSATGF
jgi:hypothetical protein